MQDILTTAEILDFHKSGKTVLSYEKMPLLTDAAQETMARLGMKIEIRANQIPQNNPSTQAPTAKPSDGYGPGEQVLVNSGVRTNFRDLIHTGKKIVGTFVQTPHPVMTEFLGKLGFDFLTIDAEHNAMHSETVQKLLQGLNGTGTLGMVRVPTITYEAIAGMLDIGAEALLIPQIRTMEDVQRIKEYALYPPQGKRGCGPSRATGYGLDIMEKAQDPDRTTNLVLQIETVAAMENLEKILSESFFDMIFIGPGDLSMDMGIFGQFTNPKLVEGILRILDSAKRHGKKAGIFAGNFEVASNWFEKGFDMAIVNSELALMSSGMLTGLANLKR